jgi:hypothetical protein
LRTNSFFAPVFFPDDCKIWKRQPAAYKTWPQFKVDFAVAYQEYSEALDVTPAASGFHAEEATDQQETIKAIANLATATAEDRKAVANLTGTNATLTKELLDDGLRYVTEGGFWGLSMDLISLAVVAAPHPCSETDKELLLDGFGAARKVWVLSRIGAEFHPCIPLWPVVCHPPLQRQPLPTQRQDHERHQFGHKGHKCPGLRLWEGEKG